MGKVTVIPSTINPLTQMPLGQITKRKVAAYARVSTDSDEQYTSYDSQCKKYEEYIKANPQWEFVAIYADEGITGTNRKRRVNFNRMIDDAKAGKIDLIVTKSISRFARNTVDTISLTRELKRIGVEVFFEKENIWSLEDKSEFVLTVLASAAQEESRSISQNVTMGKRWKMQEGKTSWAYNRFLGFAKTDEGIVLVEEEAKIVREIYRLFLTEGKTCMGIANILNANGIPTPSGKEGCTWKINNVLSILTNEKYKGDSKLQKTFTVDFLEHKTKKNEGEIDSYYVKDSHPYIIDKSEWEMVQAELVRRREIGASYSGNGPFSSKLICADCGCFYGPKIWHAGTKYQRVIYRCNDMYNKKHAQCVTPKLSESDIKAKFIEAYNMTMVNKDALIEDALMVKDLLTNVEAENKAIAEEQANIEIISEAANKIVKENQFKAQDQDEYQRKYDELNKRFNEANDRLKKAIQAKNIKLAKALSIETFIEALKRSPDSIAEWDEKLWNVLLESGTVNRDQTITFKFKNGTEARV